MNTRSEVTTSLRPDFLQVMQTQGYKATASLGFICLRARPIPVSDSPAVYSLARR